MSAHDALPMWTITFDTSDFPGVFCARKHLIHHGYSEPTAEHFTGTYLIAMRETLVIEHGMSHRLDREPADERVIVESWV